MSKILIKMALEAIHDGHYHYTPLEIWKDGERRRGTSVFLDNKLVLKPEAFEDKPPVHLSLTIQED